MRDRATALLNLFGSGAYLKKVVEDMVVHANSSLVLDAHGGSVQRDIATVHAEEKAESCLSMPNTPQPRQGLYNNDCPPRHPIWVFLLIEGSARLKPYVEKRFSKSSNMALQF